MYDKKLLKCFLDNQLKLFPEEVALTKEEAKEFLEDCLATVVRGRKEVIEYFEEEGLDFEGEDIMEAAEVFDVGDGRFLIVEA